MPAAEFPSSLDAGSARPMRWPAETPAPPTSPGRSSRRSRCPRREHEGIWIHRRQPEAVLAEARELERRREAGRGAAALRGPLRGQGQHRRRRGCPPRPAARRSPIRARRSAPVVRRLQAAGGAAHRQDQPGPVRHRAGRHAVALRRPQQPVRRPLHRRRVELRVGGGGGARAGELRAGHRHGRLGPGAGGLHQPRRAQTEPRSAQHHRRRARLSLARLRLGLRAHRARTRRRWPAAAAGLRRQDPCSRARGRPQALEPRRRRAPAASASACPRPADREFFGDTEAERLFEAAIGAPAGAWAASRSRSTCSPFLRGRPAALRRPLGRRAPGPSRPTSSSARRRRSCR